MAVKHTCMHKTFLISFGSCSGTELSEELVKGYN